MIRSENLVENAVSRIRAGGNFSFKALGICFSVFSVILLLGVLAFAEPVFVDENHVDVIEFKGDELVVGERGVSSSEFSAMAVSGGCNGIIVDSFFNFIDPTGLMTQVVRSEINPVVDHLMIRNLDNQTDEIVNGRYLMGFFNNNGGLEFVGYAENIYRGVSGWEGYEEGIYYETIGIGQRPDGVMIVYDGLEDGIGCVDGGTWILGDDDILYSTLNDPLLGEVELNGNINDATQLPIYNDSSSAAILPHTVVVQMLKIFHVSPDNGSQGDIIEIIGTGFGSKSSSIYTTDADFNGDGVVAIADFGAFALSYGSNSTSPNYGLNFDINKDGVVAAADFGFFSIVYGSLRGDKYVEFSDDYGAVPKILNWTDNSISFEVPYTVNGSNVEIHVVTEYGESNWVNFAYS